MSAIALMSFDWERSFNPAPANPFGKALQCGTRFWGRDRTTSTWQVPVAAILEIGGWRHEVSDVLVSAITGGLELSVL